MSAEVYEALLMLQHRGQDSAGMVTTDGQRFREHRDNGLVREVFGSQALLDMMAGAPRSQGAGGPPRSAASSAVLQSICAWSGAHVTIRAADHGPLRLHAGNCGLGHVRYPTAGSLSAQEAQPFFVNSPLGIYLIHNGNLTNTERLRDTLTGSESFYSRHLRTESDSEVRLHAYPSMVRCVYTPCCDLVLLNRLCLQPRSRFAFRGLPSPQLAAGAAGAADEHAPQRRYC